MYLTVVASVLLVVFTKLNPWYDDSAFVTNCETFRGKSIQEVLEFTKSMNRRSARLEHPVGTLRGYASHTRDGRFIYFWIPEYSELTSETRVWNDEFFNRCKISDVEVFRVTGESAGRLILEPELAAKNR